MFFKIEIYVPADHAETLRAAIAAAGAGRLGNYDSCIWSTAGIGQFRPLPGSSPAVGSVGKLETVPEVKLETICDREHLRAVIAALRAGHPYETPAFQFWPVALDESGM